MNITRNADLCLLCLRPQENSDDLLSASIFGSGYGDAQICTACYNIATSWAKLGTRNETSALENKSYFLGTGHAERGEAYIGSECEVCHGQRTNHRDDPVKETTASSTTTQDLSIENLSNNEQFFCKNCSLKICVFCKEMHLALPLFSNHDVIKTQLCSSHTGHMSEFYCLTCHEIVCSICIMRDHNAHNVHHASEARILKLELQVHPQLKHKINQVKERLSELQSRKAKVLSGFDAPIEALSKALSGIGDPSVSEVTSDLLESTILQKQAKKHWFMDLEDIIHSYLQVCEGKLDNLNDILREKSQKRISCADDFQNLMKGIEVLLGFDFERVILDPASIQDQNDSYLKTFGHSKDKKDSIKYATCDQPCSTYPCASGKVGAVRPTHFLLRTQNSFECFSSPENEKENVAKKSPSKPFRTKGCPARTDHTTNNLTVKDKIVHDCENIGWHDKSPKRNSSELVPRSDQQVVRSPLGTVNTNIPYQNSLSPNESEWATQDGSKGYSRSMSPYRHRRLASISENDCEHYLTNTFNQFSLDDHSPVTQDCGTSDLYMSRSLDLTNENRHVVPNSSEKLGRERKISQTLVETSTQTAADDNKTKKFAQNVNIGEIKSNIEKRATNKKKMTRSISVPNPMKTSSSVEKSPFQRSKSLNSKTETKPIEIPKVIDNKPKARSHTFGGFLLLNALGHMSKSSKDNQRDATERRSGGMVDGYYSMYDK